MAITGIVLMGFVFAHMVGNLKMYLGLAEFDNYGEFLREILVPILPRTVFLWIMRIGLIVAFALHIHAAYSLTLLNRRARSTNYQSKRDYIAANYASRTMRVSGIIVGLFIVFHLFDLSWTGTGSTFVRGDPYANVARSLEPSPGRDHLHRGQHRPRLPPVPRGVEPVPVDGLEQPPLQPMAAELRRRVRRADRRRQRLVPDRRARRHRQAARNLSGSDRSTHGDRNSTRRSLTDRSSRSGRTTSSSTSS